MLVFICDFDLILQVLLLHNILKNWKVIHVCLNHNGLVVKVPDYQSRGPVSKTTGWLQG